MNPNTPVRYRLVCKMRDGKWTPVSKPIKPKKPNQVKDEES